MMQSHTPEKVLAVRHGQSVRVLSRTRKTQIPREMGCRSDETKKSSSILTSPKCCTHLLLFLLFVAAVGLFVVGYCDSFIFLVARRFGMYYGHSIPNQKKDIVMRSFSPIVT